jgi:hypothetical protein
MESWAGAADLQRAYITRPGWHSDTGNVLVPASENIPSQREFEKSSGYGGQPLPEGNPTSMKLPGV